MKNKSNTLSLFSYLAITSSLTINSVFAASYEIEMQGFATIKSYLITGQAPLSALPFYQYPRLGYYEGVGEGPGWQTSLSLSIDAETALPLDYTITMEESFLYSFNTEGAFLFSSGFRYLANAAFKSANNCFLTNNFDTIDGFITIQCPSVPGVYQFGEVDPAGVQCVAEHPFSATSTPPANLCNNSWSGGGGNIPEAAITAASYFPANSSIGGVPIAIGPNPELFASTDYGQNLNSELASAGGLTGATISINHTGSPATGDFVIVAIAWDHRIEETLSYDPTGTASLIDTFEFVTLVSQELEQSTNAKSVPAIGAWGLWAMLFGLLSVGSTILHTRRDASTLRRYRL